jgi:hypothetical protein
MPERPIFVVHWQYKSPNITIHLSKHLNLRLWSPVQQNLKTDSFTLLFVPLLKPSRLYFHIFPNSPKTLSDFRKSELSLRGGRGGGSSTCVYKRQSSWNSNSNTLELDRPLHDRPTVCVIAQQYSSVAFVSLTFIPTCTNSVPFKNVIKVTF